MNGYNQQNVTFIDELPELSDLEGPQPYGNPVRNQRKDSAYDIIPSEHSNKVQKFIKNPHHAPSQAGMAPYNYQSNNNMIFNEEEAPHQQMMHQHNWARISCLEICEHIKECPICSKLYNNDKTVYVLAIVLLSIICVLLLKKILDI